MKARPLGLQGCIGRSTEGREERCKSSTIYSDVWVLLLVEQDVRPFSWSVTTCTMVFAVLFKVFFKAAIAARGTALVDASFLRRAFSSVRRAISSCCCAFSSCWCVLTCLRRTISSCWRSHSFSSHSLYEIQCFSIHSWLTAVEATGSAAGGATVE